MKCPNCNGQRYKAPDVPCGRRAGKGVVEPLTNEEYLCACSTEERAKFLTEVILSDRRFRMTMIGGIEETKAWLKEKYYGNTSTENL